MGVIEAVAVSFLHGAKTVRAAQEACRAGTATPKQQQIVAEMLDAMVSK